MVGLGEKSVHLHCTLKFETLMTTTSPKTLRNLATHLFHAFETRDPTYTFYYTQM